MRYGTPPKLQLPLERTPPSARAGQLEIHSARQCTPQTGPRRDELTQCFQSVERQVEVDSRVRRQTEDSTVENLLLDAQRLEDCLKQETERRLLQLELLKKDFLHPMLAKAQSKLEASFLNQFERVYSQVDALSDRLQTVEKAFKESRSYYVGHMEKEASAVENEIGVFRQHFEKDVTDRQECLTDFFHRLEALKMQSVEKLARDERLSQRKFDQLKRGADDMVVQQDEEKRRFQAQLEAELRAIKAAMADASQARNRADNELLTALNHYTMELQEAVGYLSEEALAAAAPAPASAASVASVARGHKGF